MHEGCALDTSRVSVRTGERDSVLFVREAQRADSGRYQLRVQLGGLEDTATINILIVGMRAVVGRGSTRGFLSSPRAGGDKLNSHTECGKH